MIVEVVYEGKPSKMKGNEQSCLRVLMNKFTPLTPPERWIAIGQDGTVLDPEKPLGAQVVDGQRIYITRQAGTAA